MRLIQSVYLCIQDQSNSSSSLDMIMLISVYAKYHRQSTTGSSFPVYAFDKISVTYMLTWELIRIALGMSKAACFTQIDIT